jgi:hypothetical protein
MLMAGSREGVMWSGGGPESGVIVYPPAYFIRAYFRAVTGLAGALGAWYAIPASGTVSLVCGVVAGAFALYAVQIRLRQLSAVRWDGEGVHLEGPLPRSLQWSELREVRLAYYSTRRDGENGWMQLKIRGKSGVLRVDSDADGFDRLVITSLHHAGRLGLDVTAVTRHNAAVLVRPGGSRPS